MKRFLFTALASAAALWSASCSSGSFTPPPPPVGNFTTASLNGTYAFVTSGEVTTGAGATPLVRTGSFIADGQGNIKGGVEDVNATGTVSPAISITGGNYMINPDGRGSLTFNVNSGGFTSQVNFGIVLTSTSDGLMMDETSNTSQASTGSGNFIKQDPNSFVISAVAGSYVFDFSGLDPGQAPASIVGEFTANGSVPGTGFEDVNDNGTLGNGTISVAFAPDPANNTLAQFGRGLADIGGETYAFYIVGANRVRLISASTSFSMLTGDAVAQQSNLPASLNSSYAFILAGTSLNFLTGGGLTRVGRFTTSAGSVTNVLVDTNNAGQFILTNPNNVSSASISLDPANPGRGALTITASNSNTPFTAVFYLSSASSGVIQETTQSNLGPIAVADGSIVAQTGSPFSGSNVTGPYALNWSGVSTQQGFPDEEDFLGEATVSNLALSGASDLFEFTGGFGFPVTNIATTGSINFNGGNGSGDDGKRSNMSVNLAGNSPISFVVYWANPQLAFFANNSNPGNPRIVAGVLKAQP